MTGKRAKPTAAESAGAGRLGLIPQLLVMSHVLWHSPVRRDLVLLTVAVFVVIGATAYSQILLNSWNQPFYDSLAHRRLGGFILELGVFAQIAGALLVLNVAQRWLNLMIKLKLREGLAQDLVAQWLQSQRAFRLAFAGAIGVNPDQRMHEDTTHLTELSTDLGTGLFQAFVLLASFVAVLWEVSGTLRFHLLNHDFAIPGYMVWAAISYAGSASFLTYVAGRRLVRENAERYGREAALRFSLMRVNEHINAISVSGGEIEEQRRIGLDLSSVLGAMRQLVTTLTGLTWVTAGYGWFTIVAPIIVAAPMYFAGRLSFGGLMMAVGAFNQVQASLRWFIDNFSVIADWRATLFRVVSFRNAVTATDEDKESHIIRTDGVSGVLTLEKIEIFSPGGRIRLQEEKIEIKAGERVLIVGRRRSGKTLLFYALAGLWPWGSGSVTWPKGARVLHVPRIPYFPPGTLREVLAYPLRTESFATQSFIDTLTRLGLQRLVPLLDKARPWDRELSVDEQQAVAFSRALLQHPDWILADEALESLYEETRGRIRDLFSHELASVGLIYIGRTDTHDHFFSHIFHVEREPGLRILSRWIAKDLTEPPLATIL